MTNRVLLVLIVLFSLAEAMPSAGAFPGPVVIPDMLSTDASGAVILVRKGKGHGDGEERFERHRRHDAHRRHSRGFNGNHSGSRGGNQNQPDGQN
jgi:hypothetical protein